MSMYEEDRYHSQKNDIYDEMKRFLEDHPVYELLKIVADVVKYTEREENKKAAESEV